MIRAADVFIDRRRFWVRLPDGGRRRLDSRDVENAGLRCFNRLGQEDADKRSREAAHV